ncbi:hypothetical protein ACTFIY_006543 [Dictyostelium cf. discoideum]
MNSSPITQVSNPNDSLNHSSTNLIPSSHNSINNYPQKSVKGNRKKKGSIINKLFCCFVPSNDQNNNGNNINTDNGASNNDKLQQQKQYNQQQQYNQHQQHQQQQQQQQQYINKDSQQNGEIPLMVPMIPRHVGLKTLVLDLDETLVHSSFKPVHNPDFIVPVEIEGTIHQVYVVKRPFVDDFLRAIAEKFEIVVFTASLAKYADPVLDFLDTGRVIHYRLFRESCHNHKGNYVKDLSKLGRDLKSTIIVDNSPSSYLFHPENAIPIDSWFDDKDDRELLDLLPLLDDLIKVEDVRLVLDESRNN